jgi:hypothetical protein
MFSFFGHLKPAAFNPEILRKQLVIFEHVLRATVRALGKVFV